MNFALKTKWILSLVLISFTLSNCSSKAKKTTPPVVTTAAATATSSDSNPTTPPAMKTANTEVPPASAATTNPASTAPSKELAELKETIKKAEQVTTAAATPPVADAHAHEHYKKEGVPAEKALGWLKNGNIRYTKKFLRKDGMDKKDIEKLASGQNPHSIILSCSDSRVPPELVFDQKLGEVFVIRTAGESLDFAAISSIEYAVEHLGSKLIVVMGHTSCGAVKESHGAASGADIGSPYLNALVAEIQPRIASKLGKKASDAYEEESWDNTKGAARELIEKSKIVRDAIKSKGLRVESALYYLKTGKVEWAQ